MTHPLHEQKQLTFLNLFNEQGSTMCEKSFDLVLDLIHRRFTSTVYPSQTQTSSLLESKRNTPFKLIMP